MFKGPYLFIDGFGVDQYLGQPPVALVPLTLEFRGEKDRSSADKGLSPLDQVDRSGQDGLTQTDRPVDGLGLIGPGA